MSLELVVSRPKALSIHQAHELLLKLAEAGFSPEMAQQVIESKGNFIAKSVVRTVQSNGYEASDDMRRARTIMGTNYFGPEEAIKYFGVTPTRAQQAFLATIPFSDICLQEYRETHVLVAVFPMSIVEIRNAIEALIFLSREEEHRCERQAFARDRGRVGWHLVRKEPTRRSFEKSWEEQLATLPPHEQVPTSRVVIYTTIGFFLAYQKRFLSNCYVHCADVDGHARNHVVVGSFDEDGLFVGHHWPDCCSKTVGIALERVPDRTSS